MDIVNMIDLYFMNENKQLMFVGRVYDGDTDLYKGDFALELNSISMGIDPESEFEDELLKDVQVAYNEVGMDCDAIKRLVEMKHY